MGGNTGFQSTLPMKGATVLLVPPHIDGVSIHAPNEGSDNRRRLVWTSAYVSIHAPNEGSDADPVRYADRAGVSIHAPNEGSDRQELYIDKRRICFNPRSQ